MTKTATVSCKQINGVDNFSGQFTYDDCVALVNLTPAKGDIQLTNFRAAMSDTDPEILMLYHDPEKTEGHFTFKRGTLKQAVRNVRDAPEEWE